MAFHGLEMNFPLLANIEANMVPGTGYQETDFFFFLCLDSNMGRIIMKCYIHTKLHSGRSSVYTGN